MSKHTKGPWRVVVELREEDECVCDMLNHAWVIPKAGTKLANWRDDAELISAAPELLEALEAICLMQARNYGDATQTHLDLPELVVKARAAIAKARGEA